MSDRLVAFVVVELLILAVSLLVYFISREYVVFSWYPLMMFVLGSIVNIVMFYCDKKGWFD